MAKQKEDDFTPAVEGPRSFPLVLQQVNHGSLDVELSEDFHRLLGVLAKEASAVGKAKGKIGITLSIVVNANGVVTITADKKIIEPKPQRGEAIFWLTPGGNLTQSDPKQTKLPLREVAGPVVRDVPAVAQKAGE